MIALIQILLSVISMIMKRANDQQLIDLGRDQRVKEQLEQLVVRTGVARQIAEKVSDMPLSDIDTILRKHYRD